ncbi:MAG: amidohydrolase [Verrucomicrobia bacterium]|nr:amidohydrolase [Verrucomicrobiota bacterium]
MGLIDCHVHLYPPVINRDPAGWAGRHGEPHWAQLCTRRRKDGHPVQSFPSPGALLRAMDAAGVERAVLQGWYWEQPENCATQNRFYAKCVSRHTDRLSAFATLHPRAGPDAVRDEVRRSVDAGLVGLGELSPHSQGYAMDDPGFLAALDLAAQWGLPVNLHVTDPRSRPYPGRIETPLADFARLAAAFPAVTFILAHWGGLGPLQPGIEPAPANVLYDTAASPLMYDETIWRRFLQAVPAGRVLFGSDFPLNLYPRIDAEANLTRLVAELHRAGLDAATLRAMVQENPRRVLAAARAHRPAITRRTAPGTR